MPINKTKVILIYDQFSKNKLAPIVKLLKKLKLEVTLLLTKGVGRYNQAAKLMLTKPQTTFIVALTEWGILPFMYFSKIRGLLVAEISDEHSAHMTKEHNNANVLSLATRISNVEQIQTILSNFFNAQYEGKRHKVRLDMLDAELTQQDIRR
jgi:RpiB/LacA/LacB family sugar-phosphate isomerase